MFPPGWETQRQRRMTDEASCERALAASLSPRPQPHVARPGPAWPGPTSKSRGSRAEDKSHGAFTLAVISSHRRNTLPAERERTVWRCSLSSPTSSLAPLSPLQVGMPRSRSRTASIQTSSSLSPHPKNVPPVSRGSISWPDASCHTTCRKNTS